MTGEAEEKQMGVGKGEARADRDEVCSRGRRETEPQAEPKAQSRITKGRRRKD